ncbi:Glutamine transport ATP-binding protein GlnQ [bioreactor metagenome]|uniref:Glutamine transport ATP-binding protein GlnQ n=1 Tax=bioreactor metagenome TaxID=1076179 RepID=A0A645G1V9_9ZZZZ
MLDPKILCFDEPTSALDAQTSQQVVSIIRQLQTDGLGIIIVSHDQAFIQQLTDKIIRFQ